MKLVIAEKPMLARDIARAITGKTVSETARLPISGNGYTVCACAGHLLELKDPEKMDKKWAERFNLETLPIYIENWAKEPTKDKKDLVESIRQLLVAADEVINAGDPDDEGQMIVDEVLDYLGYKGKTSRVYVNDNIEKNIVKAFQQLVPNEQCRPAGLAAYARQMADFCFGANESRLASARLHGGFSIGRVQTPTLGLVVNRDEAIEKHVKQKYYELSVVGTVDDTLQKEKFIFKPTEEFLEGFDKVYDPHRFDKAVSSLNGRNIKFTTKANKQIQPPPLPYNLTTLLADMSKMYKMTANETQDATQSLRDQWKAITYNRTDSRYLKEEFYPEAPTTLSCAMKNLNVQWPLDFKIKSKAFNDTKVTAHHAIIPQESSFDIGKLSANERRVYEAIVRRYAMQFLPPAEYAVTESSFNLQAGVFVSVKKKITNKGWKTLEAKTDADSTNATDDEQAENSLMPGEHILRGMEPTVTEKETTPPKRYTEGTLITDMSSIAKYVTDPQIKEILKKKDEDKEGEHGGIGTTATRANIIETLKKRGFIENSKGKIISTAKGREFYHLLPENIKKADTTARWWLIQQDIVDGKANINAIQKDVVRVFNEHKDDAYVGAAISASTGHSERPVVGACPNCGQPLLLGPGAINCKSNKYSKQSDGKWVLVEGCGFSLPRSWSQKKLTQSQWEKLLTGDIIAVKGFTSKKTGKKFDCKIKLNENHRIEPIFK